MNKLINLLILFSLVVFSWLPVVAAASSFYEYESDPRPAPVTIITDTTMSSHETTGEIINLPNKYSRVFDNDEYDAMTDYVCRYHSERRYGCKRQKVCGWRRGYWVCWWSHKKWCGWYPVWIKRCYWN